MELTADEGNEIVWGEHKDWENEEFEKVDGHSRWEIHKSAIFKHIPTGKFYRLSWDEGATESQEHYPFEYTEPELSEVHLVEKIIKTWEVINLKKSV